MNSTDYSSLIEKLCKEFKKGIIESNEELEKAFKNILKQHFDNLKKDNNKSKEEIIAIIISIAEDLINADLETRKQILLKDIYYEKIKKISYSIFSQAVQIFSENKQIINDSRYDKRLIDEMIEYKGQVEEYNIKEADKLISEALLDWHYIQNPKIKVYSFRFANYMSEYSGGKR